MKFVNFQRERVNKKEIPGATVIKHTKSIKLFCEMPDISIPWKKITRGLPRGKKYADDRIPTLEMRVGAWDYLRWSHVSPVEENGKVIAAKMIVYAGEEEEYFTFISPAASTELSASRK